MTEIEKDKNRLLKLLKENALKFGKIKLSSGKASDYYIDAKQVTLDPEGAYLTAKLFLDMLKDEKFDAIGGLTIGADPIVGAIAAVSYQNNRPVQTFIVRKEPKKHGMQKYIEGRQLKPNSRVIIVDDVMTLGNSALKAIEVVKEAKCVIVKVIALVDRLEGARETLSRYNYELISIFTKEDFVDDKSKAQAAEREPSKGILSPKLI